MKNRILKVVAVALALACAGLAAAENMVVIVNKANDSAIDKNFVVKVYTGESKQWAGGGAIVAYDLAEDNPGRAAFSSAVLGKTLGNMKALWAQNMFSGKAIPPKTVATDDDIKKAVSSNKNAIGYISEKSVDATVKVAPIAK